MNAAEVSAWFGVAGVAAARSSAAVAAVAGDDIAHKSWLVAGRGGFRGEERVLRSAWQVSPERVGALGCVAGDFRRAEPVAAPDPAGFVVSRFPLACLVGLGRPRPGR